MRAAVFDDMVRTQAGAWARPFLLTVVLDLLECFSQKKIWAFFFNELFLLKRQLHFKVALSRAVCVLPRRSNAEIFIGCLFSFFPKGKKKKKTTSCSFQNRVSFVSGWSFISVILYSQREFHTTGRELGGEEGAIFGLRFIRGECELEGCVLLHLQLIFSRELRLMSGSSELSDIDRWDSGKASWGEVWDGLLFFFFLLIYFWSGCKFKQNCIEFEDVYLV